MDGYDSRRKILAAIMRTVQAAKDALGMDKLASLAEKLFKLKADMEGAAVAWREDIASAVKADKELQEFISGDDALAKVVKARGNYDPATVYASLNHAVEQLEKAFLKSKEQEKQIGEIKLSRDTETEKAEDVMAAAKERVEAAKAELEEAEKALKDSLKNAKDITKPIAKSNIEKLYRSALEDAKDYAKSLLDEQKKKDKKPAEEKKEEKAPAGKPGEKGKGLDMSEIKKMLEEKTKKPEPAKSKTSLNGTPKTAAEGDEAAAPAAESADHPLFAKLAEIQQIADSVKGGIESMASAVEMADAAIDGAVAAAAEANQMLESAPAESEEAEEPEADESEEPGMMDSIMDTFMPAPSMEMAPAPASVADAWVKQSAEEPAMEREADAKRYPAEEDLSSNSFEFVESDGARQLLIKKDLKSKVTQKITDHLAGKYRKAERVAIDLGDRIAEASMIGYLGNGKYEVIAEGRTMKVPDEQIFRADDIWGA